MSAAVRLGDKCSGHGPFSPRPSTEGSPKTIVNNKPVVRVGDAWANHPHPGKQASGSPTVFAEGKAIARVGDNIDCGSKSSNGSPDVFIG
jgi:uncharacterized Zn-binding protein involved in type VI secretion